jgi:hypothetical protein
MGCCTATSKGTIKKNHKNEGVSPNVLEAASLGNSIRRRSKTLCPENLQKSLLSKNNGNKKKSILEEKNVNDST